VDLIIDHTRQQMQSRRIDDIIGRNLDGGIDVNDLGSVD
jgi:hypothetical protein